MFKALASILKKAPADPPPIHSDEASAHADREDAPIYQSLAMTEEMREAIFPTTPQMISTIFERPAAARPASDAPAPQSFQAPPTPDRGFPIV